MGGTASLDAVVYIYKVSVMGQSLGLSHDARRSAVLADIGNRLPLGGTTPTTLLIS